MTLTVRGLNALHQFRAGQHTYAWEGVKDSDIAAEIGRNPLNQTRPGINYPLRTDPTAREAEVPDRYVFMNNMYDIVFLMERARRRDYVLVLRETDADGNADPHIYFGPSNNRDAPAYELEWGKTLVSFNPTLTTANQVSEVVVLGWDRQRNRRIEGKASWESLIPRRNRAEAARQQRLMQAFGSRREVVTDKPVRDESEADDRARRILRELRKGMVEANGETVGLPGLLAGRKVQDQQPGRALQRRVLRHRDHPHHRQRRLPHHIQGAPRRGISRERRLGGACMAKFSGIVQGKVASEPDGLGRVRVRLAWMEGESRVLLGACCRHYDRPRARGVVHARDRRRCAGGFRPEQRRYRLYHRLPVERGGPPPTTDGNVRLIRSVNGHEITIYDPQVAGGDSGYISIADAHGNEIILQNANISIRSTGTINIQAPNVIINGRPVAVAPKPI